MNFNTEKAIYVQIADRLCDEILTGKFADDERIPSVREYAVLLEVNTNTTVKSYDLLEQQGVIYKKRGLGYFVTAGAKEKILEERRREFMETRLPEMFRQMRLLGIGLEEVERAWISKQKTTNIQAKAT